MDKLGEMQTSLSSGKPYNKAVLTFSINDSDMLTIKRRLNLIFLMTTALCQVMLSEELHQPTFSNFYNLGAHLSYVKKVLHHILQFNSKVVLCCHFFLWFV